MVWPYVVLAFVCGMLIGFFIMSIVNDGMED